MTVVPYELGLPPAFAVPRPALRRALRLAHRAATTCAWTRRSARRSPRAETRRQLSPVRAALVRARPAVVQARGLLRDPPARVLRRQRRRLGRLPRADREARLPAVARRRLHLAAADVPLPAARRRLRHRRLLRRPPRLRDDRGRPRVHRGGPRARHPRDRRPRHEPHVLGPPVVPARPRRARGVARARLVRVVRHAASYEDARIIFVDTETVQLDLGRAGRRLLLAPLLRPPARPQLRQPRGPARRCSTSCASGWTSASTASASTPSPTSSSARARTARTSPRRTTFLKRGARDGRRRVPRPRPARRGQPVARGRRRVLRRRRRVPHGLPLPGHAAHVHVAAPRGRHADPRDPRAARRRSPTTASGACSCATTTS